MRLGRNHIYRRQADRLDEQLEYVRRLWSVNPLTGVEGVWSGADDLPIPYTVVESSERAAGGDELQDGLELVEGPSADAMTAAILGIRP